MSMDTLPFARGDTHNGIGSGPLLTAGEKGSEFEGEVFYAVDRTGGTNQPIKLRAVRNNSGDRITVARKLYSFSTGALDMGRQVSGLSRVGEAAKPIDDAYLVGSFIKTNDVFFMLEEGPAKLTASSTSNTLTQHSEVAAAALGVMVAAPAGDGQNIIGKIDTAIGAGDISASAIVWIYAGLSGGQGG